MVYSDCISAASATNGADSDNCAIDSRSTDELEEEIAELWTHIDAATYRLLRAIAEFDRWEAWGWGFPSTAHWLSWRVGLDLVTAREKVRVARALENLAQISERFRQGRVSYSKVRALRRIATRENEEYLLYLAENGTAGHLEMLVQAYRREDFSQRRVDALGLVAEAALGKGLDQTERGEPYQVMIHVDADVLTGQAREGCCELGNGDGISAESCRRLSCDAPHVMVAQDTEGNVLHLRRRTAGSRPRGLRSNDL